MGALDDELARLAAEQEKAKSLPPHSGGHTRFTPEQPTGLATDIERLAQDFCLKLRNGDGEAAALVRHGGNDYLYAWPYKTQYGGGQELKERIKWLKSSDRGGGRLLSVYDYNGTMLFGMINGTWCPVTTDSGAWGSYDSLGILAEWLVKHGRA